MWRKGSADAHITTIIMASCVILIPLICIFGSKALAISFLLTCVGLIGWAIYAIVRLFLNQWKEYVAYTEARKKKVIDRLRGR